MSIKELGELIKHVVDFKGDIIFDPSYPDGTPRKLLDSSKLLSMGWKPQITLEEGLANTYKDYLINNKNYRQ